jgi:hypothetical protein
MSTPIRIKRSAVPGKRPTVNDLQLGELALNTYDGALYSKRFRPGLGTDIIEFGGGFPVVTNLIYVTADGNDTNSGLKLGDAKATIKAAVGIATAGSVIKVSAGSYVENNPIEVPNQVSIVGDSLREVSVTPQNQGDLFYVGVGNYIAEMSFTGAANTGAIFAFNPNKPVWNDQSPYIQNCTNLIPNSIGMKVDGRYSIGPTKSMVLDSYTQYNQGGIGISITNEGYAQLVSLFTICPDTAVFCGSGAACDLTNSNASFGNYGLVADGVGPRKYTGIITQTAAANSDTFTLDVSTSPVAISTASYSNTTGLTTITTSTPHGFTVGMGVTIKNLAFLCPSAGDPPDIPVRVITNAVYNNVTGITTITTSVGNHRFSVGMGVSLAGLGFTCPSGPATLTYPSGREGYVFRVDSVPASNQFTVNVGPSTLPHTYVSGSGGTATFMGYTFPSGNYGYVFEVQSVPNSTSFSVYTGISTLAHNYVAGGVAKINVSRPFDGQVVYFDDLYYTVNKIQVSSGGTGYNSSPVVTISPPSTDWGVLATAVAEVTNGSVTAIEIVSSGRGYTAPPTLTITGPNVGINTATATLQLLPTYYIISSSTPVSSGICTITVNDNVPYVVGVGSTVPFFKQSRVLASGHSFEYIGSGTNINGALPAQGGVPIQDNEIDMRNGGSVIFTSTDQSGNFRIGDGVTINQTTGTISGTFYSKSLFSTMTPFILALGGE